MPHPVRLYLGLIRFSHTVFALPFALASAAVAWRVAGRVEAVEVAGILACMVAARTAAMAFNRLVDRRLDAENPRTAGRHIPAGLLSVRAVALFTVGSAAAFVAATGLFALKATPNWWPLMLSVPVLAFLLGYSLAKRFTSLAHFWLGAALALAPLAAWLAILGPVRLEVPATLAGAVLFWVTGFDLIYACQDAEFDRRSGLHSVPARLGVPGALAVAKVCHAVAVTMLAGFGALAFGAPPGGGQLFAVGLAAIALLLVYEHSLVSAADLSRVNAAFFQVNAVVSFGVLALVLGQLSLGEWE